MSNLLSLIKTEPAVFAGIVAGVVVAVASIFGVVLDVDAISAVIVSILPLVTAIFIRSKVTPTKKHRNA